MNQQLCECGCGKPAPIATHTQASAGRVKGQPCHFIHGHQRVRHGQSRKGKATDDQQTKNRRITPAYIESCRKNARKATEANIAARRVSTCSDQLSFST